MAKKEDKKAKVKGSASSKKVDKEVKKAKDSADKKGSKAKKGSSKGEKELSPLEKARIAKQNGKGGKAKAKKKNALPTFKAPEEFKPHFVTVDMKTEKDGLLGKKIRMTRYQGRFDPEADAKKKFDVGTYDPATVTGVLARFAMTTWATNAAKRLPPSTVFQALLRVNKKKDGGVLSIIFKGLSMAVKNEKTGKVKLKPLDKKDPIYRKFRKASRILPAAFVDVLMPPKRVRGANKKKDDDGDDE